MTDYAQFKRGAALFPLTTSTVNPLLKDADPALYHTLAYFESVIVTHLGDRFLAEVAAVPPLDEKMTCVVGYTSSQPPSPAFLIEQKGFPLLCVYRKSAEFEQRTAVWNHDIGEWVVEFVLPPLSPAQAERICPVLRGVEAVLADRIENTFDPNYNSGERVWASAGVEAIRLMSSKYGGYEATGELYFPAWTGTLQVKERAMPPTQSGAFQNLTGVDVAVDQTGATDPPLVDLVDAKADFIQLTDLASPVDVWRADTGVALASDSLHVSTWTGALNSTVMSAPTQGPVVESVIPIALGGVQSLRAALRFDETASQYLLATLASLAADTGKTYVIAGRLLNTSTRGALVSHTLASDTGTHTASIAANVTSTVGNRFGLEADGSTFDTQTPTDTAWHVWAVRTSDTTNGQSITGTTDVHIDSLTNQTLTSRSGSGNWAGMSTSNLLTVGGNPAVSATFASVDVAVVMAWSSRLTDAQLTTAIQYCNQYLGR